MAAETATLSLLAEAAVPFTGYTASPATPAAADMYFANEQGVVAAFDFDYEAVIDFEQKFKWAQLAFSLPAWFSCLCCVPCYLNQNVEWTARAQHVALTVDGIRYVTEKRKSCCGFTCSDVGKDSKTVPYDKITDCDVREPAGMACCCCIENTLSVVHVDTASSGGSKEGVVRHELALKGLKFPNEFKEAVWGMKRCHAPRGVAGPLGAGAAAPEQVAMDMKIFVEIRNELRELNALMRTRA